MLDKDGTLISIAAGTFGYCARKYIEFMNGKKFTWWQFLIELALSAGLGYGAFWICSDHGSNDSMSAAAAGMLGHLGRDFFGIAKGLVLERLKNYIGNGGIK